MMQSKSSLGVSVIFLLLSALSAFGQQTTAFASVTQPDQPRIVNIYNFCRNSDYRVPNSEAVLLETTVQQIKLVHKYHLPATWALQYDALITPAYQKLMKDQLGPDDEIGAWWEIPRPLAEKAGLNWRGQHDWDSASNVGFSTGYTPTERQKLVDVYMQDFKSIFGHYPKTVGSWYIDELTLAYMADKYGIVASCNCKDQVGTDGYTLWGGYWNQAYYPSRLNAYMPAQTKRMQIDVPIFRMLGSDPIYQYGNETAGIFTLEPVYPRAGGSPRWVDWFLKNFMHEPSLAFAYTQAGQENSFGWAAMKEALSYQLITLADHVAAGDLRVETLANSGEWFKSHFELTPPASVVCTDDWRGQGRKTVWYDSRYYRINLLWDGTGLTVRDLHRFDEKKIAPNHDTALTERSMINLTLPIIEGSLWAENGGDAGAIPILNGPNGLSTPLKIESNPNIRALDPKDLEITQPISGGRKLTIICRESAAEFDVMDSHGRPVQWALKLRGGSKQTKAVTKVTSNHIDFRIDKFSYDLKVGSGSVERLATGQILLRSDANGQIKLLLAE